MRLEALCSRKTLFFIFLLAAATFVLYYPLLGHPFHNWDDGTYITKNANVLKGITLGSVKWAFSTDYFGFYYPVTWLSHMADVEMYGLSSRGHYLTNMILHILNVLLLFVFLVETTGNGNRSFAVSALFAIHPLNVETVAWLAERKNLLAVFFMLVSMLLYLPAVKKENSRGKRIRFFILMCASFSLGLMSKSSIVVFPFLLLLLDVWPLQRIDLYDVKKWKRRSWDLMKEKLLLFPLCLASGLLTIAAQKKVNALHSLGSITPGQRAGEALLGYGFYLEKLFAPFKLCTFYEHHKGNYPLFLPLFIFAVMAAITWGVVLAGRKRPVFLAGWFFFLVSLLPVIGLIQAGDQGYADRYIYFACWGIFSIMVFGIPYEKIFPKNHKYAELVLFSATCAFFCLLTFRQITIWKDDRTLFENVVNVQPESFLGYLKLGNHYFNNKDPEKALGYYLEALKRKSDEPLLFKNAGILCAGRNDHLKAIGYFDKAIMLDPHFAEAHYCKALSLIEIGSGEKALEELMSAEQYGFDKEEVRSQAVRAKALSGGNGAGRQSVISGDEKVRSLVEQAKRYGDQGNWQRSAEKFREALKLAPGSAEIWCYYGFVMQSQNKQEQAERSYNRAIELDPRSEVAIYNLAILELRKGKLREARSRLGVLKSMNSSFAANLEKALSVTASDY